MRSRGIATKVVQIVDSRGSVVVTEPMCGDRMSVTPSIGEVRLMQRWINRQPGRRRRDVRSWPFATCEKVVGRFRGRADMAGPAAGSNPVANAFETLLPASAMD